MAPLTAFGVLASILVLALSNVSFLTGGTAFVDRLLLGTGAMAFGLGIGASFCMRYRHPEHYARFAEGSRP